MSVRTSTRLPSTVRSSATPPHSWASHRLHAGSGSVEDGRFIHGLPRVNNKSFLPFFGPYPSKTPGTLPRTPQV